MPRQIAFIALGANLGDAVDTLRGAVTSLSSLPRTTLQACSSFYRTAPIDSSGPDYINAVAEISTELAPADLLAALQRIESEAGRERPYRNAPRTLDLDILLYGDETIATATLTVPHPRMRERAFVLVPLAEIAPHRVAREWLARVAGQGIERIPGPQPLPPGSLPA